MRCRLLTLLSAAVLAGSAIPGPAALGQGLPHTLESPNGQLFGGFGLAVDGVGDVTGDGRADILVGADGESGPTGAFAGRAYVFDGAMGHVEHVLESPNHQSGSYFGAAVAGVGDVDGDGRPDILVGARAAASLTNDPAGRAFVFGGADGLLIRDLASPNAQAGGSFGAAVAAAGDTDGDGRPDLLVAAAGENTPVGMDAGRVYLFSGATGALLHTLESPFAQGVAAFGQSVAGIGDVDGDGRGDIAVGASNEHAGDGVRAGLVHVFSGATGAAIRTLASPNAQQSGRFGLAVAAAGDVDGDGVGDVLVGAAAETPAGPNSGRAYLFSGASGSLLRTVLSPNAAPGAFFGSSVAGGGDLDQDGHPDYLVGAAGEETAGGFGAGRAYAFSGAHGGVLFAVESPHAEVGGNFGFAVAGAGDTDGDGRPDLLIGAVGEDTFFGNAAGRAYVMAAPVATPVVPGPASSALRLVVVPNPAAGSAVLAFDLPSAGVIRLSVVDVAGREVAVLVQAERPAGPGRITFDAGALAPGVYTARLVTPQGTARRIVTVVD